LSDAADSIDNRKQKGTSTAVSPRLLCAADFFQEISSFQGQADIRLALFDVLKEQGLLEDNSALPPETASFLSAFLSALTESDVGAILRDVCSLFSDELDSRGENSPGEDGEP
jgi:hypothetical protein